MLHGLETAETMNVWAQLGTGLGCGITVGAISFRLLKWAVERFVKGVLETIEEMRAQLSEHGQFIAGQKEINRRLDTIKSCPYEECPMMHRFGLGGGEGD